MIICIVIIKTKPTKLMFAFLTNHVFAAFIFDNSNTTARTSLRSPHFLQLVEQTDVEVPAAASLLQLRSERLETGFGPRVVSLVALELLRSASVCVCKANEVAALSRTLEQRPSVRRQNVEKHFVELRLALGLVGLLHKVDDFFESESVLDVGGSVLEQSVVVALTLNVDALDSLDDDRVVVCSLSLYCLFDRPAESTSSDEFVLGFGLHPVDQTLFSNFEASFESGVNW